MRYISIVFWTSMLLTIFCPTLEAQETGEAARTDGSLQSLLNSAVDSTLEQFGPKGLKGENVAVTVIDLSEENPSEIAELMLGPPGLEPGTERL